MPVIVLDSGPLGLILQRRGKPVVDAAQNWVASLAARRTRVVVPEIVDFEVRRELIRIGKIGAVSNLDTFIGAAPDRYLPITTAAMRRAADLWADARNRGRPTADPKELDGDVILAAQVLTSGLTLADVVVATTNVGHLSRYVSAAFWSTL